MACKFPPILTWEKIPYPAGTSFGVFENEHTAKSFDKTEVVHTI